MDNLDHLPKMEKLQASVVMTMRDGEKISELVNSAELNRLFDIEIILVRYDFTKLRCPQEIQAKSPRIAKIPYTRSSCLFKESHNKKEKKKKVQFAPVRSHSLSCFGP